MPTGKDATKLGQQQKVKLNSSIREKLFVKINVKGSTIFYFQQKSVHHNFYYVKFSFIVLAIQCYGR